jgi:phosphinothricin acetyltransferase
MRVGPGADPSQEVSVDARDAGQLVQAVTRIRPARFDDAAAIASIYAQFVAETPISFETEAPGADQIAERMRSGSGAYPWLVAVDETGALVGYAYGTKFRERAAYRFAVETTVYVAPGAQRQGIGRQLYDALFEILIGQGFTQAIAAITLPNEASVRLHEAVGFQPAGVYGDIGYKLGGWHSVGIWQRSLAAASGRPNEPLSIEPLT